MNEKINFSEFFRILSKEDDFKSLISNLSSNDFRMTEKVYAGLLSRTERKRGRPLSDNEMKEAVLKICSIAANLKNQAELGPLQILDKTADMAGNII